MRVHTWNEIFFPIKNFVKSKRKSRYWRLRHNIWHWIFLTHCGTFLRLIVRVRRGYVIDESINKTSARKLVLAMVLEERIFPATDRYFKRPFNRITDNYGQFKGNREPYNSRVMSEQFTLRYYIFDIKFQRNLSVVNRIIDLKKQLRSNERRLSSSNPFSTVAFFSPGLIHPAD